MAMTLDGTSGITQMTGSIVMSGSTSGTTTIIPSAVAGTTTVTMPAVTGTMMVSGNMPAFSAYNSSTQSISNTTWTKVQFNTKQFDTASCYDNTTNYRFTPNVAGYYQVTIHVTMTFSGSSIASIYKNGSEIMTAGASGISGVINSTPFVTGLIYFNGSTDYVEGYVYQNSGSSQNTSANIQSYFQAVMVRAA